MTEKLADILQLELPQDTDPFARLPNPVNLLNGSSMDDQRRVAYRFMDHVFTILADVGSFPDHISSQCPDCGVSDDLSGDDVWNRCALVATAYLDVAFSLLSAGDPGDISSIDELLPDERMYALIKSKPDHPRLDVVAFFGEYLLANSCLLQALAIQRSPAAPSHGLAVSFQTTAHRSLLRLHDTAQSFPGGDLRTMAHRLIHSTLHRLVDLSEVSNTNTDGAAEGPFSSIRLGELELLASRDQAVCKKYGSKTVERVFEQQLALILQSLGFYVVPAQTGDRAADLLCLSKDRAAPMSFLVEAKASKRPYYLPTKDERALREYVSDFTRGLSTLPPLAFVLVVGHAPAKTLAAKLARLEASVGLPVRFLRSTDIARLRAGIPGPVPVGPFATQVKLGPTILADGFVETVCESYHAGEQAHSDFVKKIMAAQFPERARAKPDDLWPEH